MNALQQTGTPVRLGWERTKYHKQAYRHTRFPELRSLKRRPDSGSAFLRPWRSFRTRLENRWGNNAEPRAEASGCYAQL